VIGSEPQREGRVQEYAREIVQECSAIALVASRLPLGHDGIRISVSFGLNRSECIRASASRRAWTFPRVPGIEAPGVVDDPMDSGLPRARQVAGTKEASRRRVRARLYDGVDAALESPARRRLPDYIGHATARTRTGGFTE